MGTHPKHHGFTLIEVLIVVAIIGIIAAIAMPSYSHYVTKSRRAQAASCLQEHVQFMERFYTTNLRYDQDAGGNAVALPALGCTTENGLNTYYAFGFNGAVAARTYSLQASPLGAQATADAQCANLRIDQTGQRSITGPGAVKDCF